jgi:hypothetical protein
MMIEQFWIDTFVIVGMFLLRVGVPVALTIALGKWLEKRLKPREVEPELKARIPARSSNIISLHCWDVKRCDAATRAQCAAFKHAELPCWLALQMEGGAVRPQCFSCAFYKPQSMAA